MHVVTDHLHISTTAHTNTETGNMAQRFDTCRLNIVCQERESNPRPDSKLASLQSGSYRHSHTHSHIHTWNKRQRNLNDLGNNHNYISLHYALISIFLRKRCVKRFISEQHVKLVRKLILCSPFAPICFLFKTEYFFSTTRCSICTSELHSFFVCVQTLWMWTSTRT